MSQNAEVAVFIDLENLRYSCLNNFGQEPDFPALIEKAKKYGRPSVMRAYADFSEHPAELTRQLTVAGIESINVRVKRSSVVRNEGKVERIRNAADMVMAIDALLEAADADAAQRVKTFLIVSGDADYVKLVTQLRNRFGQEVVISGVEGSVAQDLVMAAGKADPIEIERMEPTDPVVLKTTIVKMVARGPAPLVFWTVKTIDQWCQDGRQDVPGTAKEKRDAIGQLLDERTFTRQTREHPKGGQVTETVLDRAKAVELGYLQK